MRWVAVSLALLLAYCASSPIKPRYRVWTAPLWYAETNEPQCEITVFALASHPVHILWKNAQGQTVQVSSTAISDSVAIPVGYRWTRTYVFLDSANGELLAMRKAYFRCYLRSARTGEIRPMKVEE